MFEMDMKNKPFEQRFRLFYRSMILWLKPGLGIKRWLLLLFFGTVFIGVGFALFVLDIYRTAPESWWLPYLSVIALRMLSRPLRVIIFGAVGIAIMVFGFVGLNRSLLKPFIQPGKPVIETITSHRRRDRGPKVVVIGGGHGLAMLIRGLKSYTYNLTAVVTVADDGGSSGRLRKNLGILPPGDIRNCLAAMSTDEALLTQLFQYRFSDGEKGLEGHSFGNLFISALSDITGNFEDAVAESAKVLAVHGRVLPSSIHDVRLVADVLPQHSATEVRIEGESRIPELNGKIRRVWLDPGNPPAYPKVIKAILSADVIVIGPGSLYTSLLPNLLVPDIANSLRASRAVRMYVCNVATQAGETDGFTCADHVGVLEDHVGEGLFDTVLMNDCYEGDLLDDMQWVKKSDLVNYSNYSFDLINHDEPWHHDSKQLATYIMDIYQARTGPLTY